MIPEHGGGLAQPPGVLAEVGDIREPIVPRADPGADPARPGALQGRGIGGQLLGELVRAWVDEIPEQELESHYAKTVADLDEHDLSMLAAWHGSLDVGQPLPNRDFLMGAFPSLGDNRREALKLAAGFRGEEAVDAGVTEERALETVLEWLSPPRLMELAAEAVELYCWDRAGSDN